MRSGTVLCIVALLGGCAAAPTLPSLVEQRQIYEQRAMGRYGTGDLVDAERNFREAVQWAELADDRAALIANLLNLGAVYGELGDHPAAVQAYGRALDLAALEQRTLLELHALAGLAEIRYRQRDRTGAAGLYQRLIAHPGIRGHRDLQVMALNGLALCAMQSGDMDAAAGYLTRAEALGETAATLLNRATLDLRRGALALAEAAARRALELDRDSGYVPGIAGDLEVLGEVARLNGDAQQARLYFTQSLSLYQQLKSPASIERVRRRRAALSP